MRLLNFLKIDFDKKRVYGLDILRALAILFVCVQHSQRFLPEKYYLKNISKLLSFDGVTIFFVLSGFLIGGILIKILENKPPTFKTLAGFWQRRWFRTLPNYYLVLTLLAIVLPLIFYGHWDNPSEKISYVFFIQNFYSPHPHFFQEAWSLSVEEWFYLMIPTLIFVLVGVFKFKPKNSILTIASAVLILVTAFRYYKYIHFPPPTTTDWDMNFRREVITRLDSLMYGLIGAFFAFYYKALWIRNKKILFAIGILILFMQKYEPYLWGKNLLGFYSCVFTWSTIALGTLLLIPLLSELKTGKGFIYTCITYISLISYSMYLLNLTLINDFLLNAPANFIYNGINYLVNFPIGPIRLFCYWFLTIFLSIVLYKYFEKPVMNLRERIK